MTVKEIWNSCLYTTFTISTAIFLWRVGSSVKNVAQTVNKLNLENVVGHVNDMIDHAADKFDIVAGNAAVKFGEETNKVIDHAADKFDIVAGNVAVKFGEGTNKAIDHTVDKLGVEAKSVVNDAIVKINEVVNHTVIEAGNLSDHVHNIVVDIIKETAARLGVTVGEVFRLVKEADVGIGTHFVGKLLSDERITVVAKSICRDLKKESET